MAHKGQRKVVVAIDGSESADNALRYYLEELKKADDYVYCITVPEYRFPSLSVIQRVGPLADVNAISHDFGEQHAKVEKLCADYTARLRTAGVKGQIDSCPGEKPGPAIVQFAEQVDADHIVMGTRGLSKIKKMILGSVSNYVLHHSSVPCSIIPLKDDQQKKE